jgi:acetyl esterase/lipase
MIEHDGDVPVYTVRSASGAPKVHVLYTHGGGWVHEISPQHWALITQLAAEAQAVVTVPIYPLLPYGDAAAANGLVLRLHERLAGSGVEVVLAGDSAGGQIALSGAMSLRDRGVERLRTLLISPALDLSLTNPRVPEVAPHDPWLGIDGIRHLADQWRAGIALDDPMVSPICGDLPGLGPMLLLSGTRDVLNPDAVLLAEKARAAAVEVDYDEQAGAVHVFALLPTPTGVRTRARIVQWLHRTC